MMAECGGDVARRGKISHQKENRDAGKRRAAGDRGKNVSSAPDPITVLRHRGAEQQGHRRVARHRIVFLRRGECEKRQDESDPANRQQPRAAHTVDRLKRKFGDGGKVDAPWKEPQKVEQPETNPGNGIVIAWITQIEKAKNLLVDEVKPEESVVFPRTAVKPKIEIRWITARRQNVPRRRKKNRNEKTADRPQPLPGSRDKQLLGQKKVEQSDGDWENGANQTLQQNPNSQAGGENEGPEPRVRLILIERAQK